MSKPVRIKDYLARQVDNFAALENRSFANMVEVLLLSALTERVGRTSGAVPGGFESHPPAENEVIPQGRLVEAVTSTTPPRSASADPVAAAEDWLKARQDRPAKPYPKRGS